MLGTVGNEFIHDYSNHFALHMNFKINTLFNLCLLLVIIALIVIIVLTVNTIY